MKNVLFLLGRVFLSSIFIAIVVKGFFSLDKVTAFFLNAIGQWLHYPFLFKWANFLIINAPTVCLIVLIVAGFGALLLFLGLWVQLGAFFLVAITLAYLVLQIPLWVLSYKTIEDFEAVLFFKDIAILGGLFLILGSSKK
jgi:uncharacterized membrane protein YphA (DoxX/SURF4 family)